MSRGQRSARGTKCLCIEAIGGIQCYFRDLGWKCIWAMDTKNGDKRIGGQKYVFLDGEWPSRFPV